MDGRRVLGWAAYAGVVIGGYLLIVGIFWWFGADDPWSDSRPGAAAGFLGPLIGDSYRRWRRRENDGRKQ